MDIKAEKLDLIQWLTGLTDETVIAKIKALKKEKADWWDTISAEEKAEIEEGIRQADKGETIPHNEVKKSYSNSRVSTQTLFNPTKTSHSARH